MHILAAILRGGDAASSLAPLRTLMPPVTFSLLCTNTLLTANWWAVLIRTIFRWPGLSLWRMFYRPITDIDVFGGAFISGDLMQRQQSCWLPTKVPERCGALSKGNWIHLLYACRQACCWLLHWQGTVSAGCLGLIRALPRFWAPFINIWIYLQTLKVLPRIPSRWKTKKDKALQI